MSPELSSIVSIREAPALLSCFLENRRLLKNSAVVLPHNVIYIMAENPLHGVPPCHSPPSRGPQRVSEVQDEACHHRFGL